MAPDLIDISKILHYLNDSGEWREIKGTLNCELKDSEPTYCSIDFDSSASATFDFKFNRKEWYRIRKALGLVKPIYKKKRKGKRYVWYEVV